MGSKRTGITLIEVIAAIGLLAALLGAAVIASARHTRQTRLAADRLAAQAIADGLLAGWLVDNAGQIAEPRGRVAGRPGWEWRLSGRIERDLEPFGLHVGRLEILRPAEPDAMTTVGSSSLIVLASVEFASSSVVTAEAAARGAR